MQLTIRKRINIVSMSISGVSGLKPNSCVSKSFTLSLKFVCILNSNISIHFPLVKFCLTHVQKPKVKVCDTKKHLKSRAQQRGSRRLFIFSPENNFLSAPWHRSSFFSFVDIQFTHWSCSIVGDK